MKIFVSDPVGLDGIDYLKSKGYEFADSVQDADAIIVRSATKVTESMIGQAKNLRVIARSGTGTDNIDKVAAKARGIVVVNAPGANAESVAEHTLIFMLAISRSLVGTVNTLKSGVWAKSDFHGMELKGKTLGIVGFGNIGGRVAELASAFGMDILVFTRSAPAVGKQVTLPELLADSDFVTLHVPLTDETRGLIGAKELGSMKPTAYLINTSRGAIVDETALIAALRNKTIAGAALDVFAREPLSGSSELLKLPNVIVTPHVAADSREGENRASLMIAGDIHRVLQGEQPVHPVKL